MIASIRTASLFVRIAAEPLVANQRKSGFAQEASSTKAHGDAQFTADEKSYLPSDSKPRQPTAYHFGSRAFTANTPTYVFANNIGRANLPYAGAKSIDVSALLNYLMSAMIEKMCQHAGGSNTLDFLQSYMRYLVAALALTQMGTQQAHEPSSYAGSSSYKPSACGESSFRAGSSFYTKPSACGESSFRAGSSSYAEEPSTDANKTQQLSADQQARRNLCEYLKLPIDTEDSKLRSAYRKEALKVHPDKGGTNEEFAALNTLYADWQKGPEQGQQV